MDHGVDVSTVIIPDNRPRHWSRDHTPETHTEPGECYATDTRLTLTGFSLSRITGSVFNPTVKNVLKTTGSES